MTTRRKDNSLGKGVYYAADDYIGIMRRIAILAVDLTVLILLGFILILITTEPLDDPTDSFWFAYVALAWTYLTILKPSKVRTVGYWLTGARIVNLRGQRPSILRMTFRLLVWLFGPFNLLFDLIWAGIDDDRQTLRDRFTGTCVIKHGAEPVGTGEIHLTYYNAFGLTLTYPRVSRPTR